MLAALLVAVLAGVALPAVAVVDDPAGASRVERLAGDDRVDTAVAVSRATFDTADTVVLATAADYPDALSGSVLAAARGGPLLLTDPGRLPDSVRDELGRLGASRVVVLGGEAAIRPSVVEALGDTGVAVRRVAGATRYETAARVAGEVDRRSTVVLATGENFPDAVAASAYAASRGWPVVLVGSGPLDPAVEDLFSDGGTRRALPVGGPAAIGDAVLARVRDTGVDVLPRLAGPTRWATSAAVARAHLQSLGGTVDGVWLATGEAFPDALSAGAAAAATGAVLQLTPGDRLDVPGTQDDPRGVLAAERTCDDRGLVASATLVGGPTALRPQVADQADALLTCAPMPTRVVAAGDIAGCAVTGDEATARLLDGLHGTVAALGDLAYDRGTAAEFANCYGPSWGRHRDRTRPAIGNHDLLTDGGAPYHDYFGEAAGPRGQGWYAFDLSDEWHAVVLNSNCWAVGGCQPGSPQHDWLLDDLATHAGQHVVAWMHHPRYSSGHHGSQAFVQPLFAALAEHGVDVVLAGHDHHYERVAPLDAVGTPDPDGLQSFVVGTGGRVLYAMGETAPHSVVRSNASFGVLELTLDPTGYAWRFVPTDPQAAADAGARDLGAPGR